MEEELPLKTNQYSTVFETKRPEEEIEKEVIEQLLLNI